MVRMLSAVAHLRIFSKPAVATLVSVAMVCASFLAVTGAQALPSSQNPIHVAAVADISGDLIDQNESPVTNAQVELIDSSQNVVLTTSADSSGHYSFDDVVEGSYTLHFSGDRIVEEWWEDQNECGCDAANFDFYSGDSLIMDATLQSKSARITGQVLSAVDQSPIEGITVQFHQIRYPNQSEDYSHVTTQSAADGSFSSPYLPAGLYKVHFAANTTLNFAPQWWFENTFKIGGDTIRISDEEVVSDINSYLQNGSSISGKVTCTATPDSCQTGIHLTTTDNDYQFERYEYSDEQGNYSLLGLLPGKYKVSFGNEKAWWGGDSSRQAAVINLQQAEDISGIDVSIDQPTDGSTGLGEISGIASDANGDPLVNAEISLSSPSRSLMYGSMSTQTDSDGYYSFANLANGSYILSLRPETDSGFGLSQYWPRAQTVDEADEVVISDAILTPTADFTLVTYPGQILGTVKTPQGVALSGVTVSAGLYTNGDWISHSAQTNSAGQYQIPGLSNGQYSLEISKSGFGAESPVTSRNRYVTVSTATPSKTANAYLVVATAEITGRVTAADAPGRSLSGLNILARLTTDSCVVSGGYATTDDQGVYHLQGLVAGSYIVAVNANMGVGCNSSGDGISQSSAYVGQILNPVVATAGRITTKNLSLQRGGVLRGKVITRGADGSVRPVQDVQVTAGSWEAKTNVEGDYVLEGLPTGTYNVQFSPTDTQLAAGYWGSSPVAPSVPISLKQGTSVTANKTLTSASSIHGTSDGSDLRLFSAISNAQIHSLISKRPNGDFTIDQLEAGSYRIVPACIGSPWNPQNLKYARTILVTGAGAQVGVDLSCAHELSGSITGKIINGNFHSLELVNEYGDFVQSFETDSEGAYELDKIPPGQYTIRFSAMYSISSAYLGGGTSVSSAQFFEVTSNEQTTVSDFTIPGPAEFFAPGKIALSGTGAVGTKLTASVTGFSPTPDKIEIAWFRDGEYRYGTQIKNASGSSYTVQAADAGHSIGISVRLIKAGYEAQKYFLTAPSTSALSFSGTPTPTISGTPKVGMTLTSNAGTWAPAPELLSTQWLRDGEPIQTAAGSTYVVTKDDLGHKISSRTIGQRAGYTSISRTSVQSATVTMQSLTLTPTPTITGTMRAGSWLTASSGTWGPGIVSLRYQWKSDGTDIAGATAQKYLLTANESGHRITVSVSGSKPNFQPVTKTSALTTVVAAPPPTVFSQSPVPEIYGAVIVGETITAQNLGWVPTPDALSYQWLRNGVAISGATSVTYTVVPNDMNKQISIAVTAKKSTYVTTTAKSAAQIAAPGLINAANPVISGTTALGQTLTVSTNAPGAIKNYIWLRNGVPIWYASGTRYKVTSADVGSNISVWATISRPGYITEFLESSEVTIAP